MYKHLLVATNDSENAKKAVEHAIQLAKLSPDSFIDIVYVVDADKVTAEALMNWTPQEKKAKYGNMIEKSVEMVKESGVSYQTTILHGFPALEIVEYANEHSFDLVVIGSRGLNVIQEFVMNGVSQKVAKRVKCPVLMIK
jgi:nucleotide-binding universal stress UspA family protein